MDEKISMTSNIPRISAVVIAYNDEANMRKCLESLHWADEIIVVDSFSTDQTAAISQEYTDKIYQHEFHGFGRLRNEAMRYATHDWIFSLDTDERATPEVRDEIRQMLVDGPDAQAYFVPRWNYFLGRWINYCGWYPDYRQPQFFHKAYMRYTDDLVHESFDVTGSVGFLVNPIQQYPFPEYRSLLRENGSVLLIDVQGNAKTWSSIPPSSTSDSPTFYIS